jgi:hypothetical protein
VPEIKWLLQSIIVLAVEQKCSRYLSEQVSYRYELVMAVCSKRNVTVQRSHAGPQYLGRIETR